LIEYRRIDFKAPVFEILIPSLTAANSQFLFKPSPSAPIAPATATRSSLNEELHIVLGDAQHPKSDAIKAKVIVYDIETSLSQKVSTIRYESLESGDPLRLGQIARVWLSQRRWMLSMCIEVSYSSPSQERR